MRIKGTTKLLASVTTGALLAAAGMLAVGAGAAPVAPETALSRLRADATGPLVLRRDDAGTLRFVGAGTGKVVNPAVSRDLGVVDAARAHLTRYRGALGVSAASSLLADGVSARTSAGRDVVRFEQRIGGLPVIAGQVAVSLRSDRQLGSLSASLSAASAVPAARLAEPAAAAVVRTAAGRLRLPAQASIKSAGRWVFDPAVLGAAAPFGARGVWRFEVTKGDWFHRLVLVDDQAGRVLLNLDQIHHVDRVVCDNDNTPAPEDPCLDGFARAEGDGATGIADVDAAYDHAGEVSQLYSDVAGVDLTELIGVDAGGGDHKLASTVRYCPQGDDCPYANAFWNGTQMFYGEGFADADDIVGHEMTHGVIDRNSSLFYWGQSGAINESIADVMGEIVDHRNGLAPADDDWILGEDLQPGGFRDMADPAANNDPDKMTSSNWWNDLEPIYWIVIEPYPDNGGVHFNSGVGNKTAYLISQGGTFNGQTMSGIDGSDDSLNKTALLYYDAIVSLVSGSDYANLADVLEQGCADLATAGTGGFTSGDCAQVHQAVLATELRTTPTLAPQPPDAAKACPAGSTLRELFNSETGSPASKFSTDNTGTWAYGVDGEWGSNATSGLDSWHADNVDGTPTASATKSVGSITLPANQQSFLWFNNWRVFEWWPPGTADDTTNTYEIDGGTVEIDNVGDSAGPVDASSLPWVNGPTKQLDAYPGEVNPWSGRHAFAGDSFGFLASRANLSAYHGRSVKLQFTSRGDGAFGFLGWWLDDISVYTCDGSTLPPSIVSTVTGLKVKGGVGSALVSWKAPATNPAAVKGYRINTAAKPVVKVSASTHRLVVGSLQPGRNYTFTVTPTTKSGQGPPRSVVAKGTRTTMKVTKVAGRTVLSGRLSVGDKGLKGRVLKALIQGPGLRWAKIGKVTTGKGGRYVLRLGDTLGRPLKVRFAGGVGLIGSDSPKSRR